VLGLKKRGHDVFALVHKKSDEDICTQFDLLPAPLKPLGSPFAWMRTAKAIKKAITKCKPDIIHFLVEPYTLGMPLVKCKCPWVMNLNGTFSVLPLYQMNTRPMFKHAYRKAHHIFTPSEYTKIRTLKAVNEKCGPKLRDEMDKKISLVKLGVFPKEIDRKSDADTKHILFVGGVKARKGVEEIIEGCGKLAEKSSQSFHLHIVGSTKDTLFVKKLKDLSDELGIQDKVTFHGHALEEELDDLYSKADLFVMLSKSDGYHFEGFGLVFIEAASCGIPCIASKDSGCEEAVDEEVSGFAVDHTDPEMIAERMQWILEEEKIKSDNCKAWAKKHSVNNQIEAFERVYEKLLA